MDCTTSTYHKTVYGRGLNEATTERIGAAGNVSGELLNWIALLAVVGEHRPAFLEAQLDAGFGYAAWRFDR